MNRKEPRPPNSRAFFPGTIAVAVCVGTAVMASMSGWQSTVAGIAAAGAVALVARLWHRQADLRYRKARILAEQQNDIDGGAS
ncbi:hypothetical protein [Streptomyces sp. MST-110588]|uniref:hypothetical protein n=1 Tax=Streptomyces sp. MST-110588 TaxID=2833628 RepID=UPI001F5E056E|nr:hypothetical protein [Streptomyces sp. MST-110588]UNO38671.1 hypothetical protein KGS77_02170 [Streptomyces sp. MST-110588]